MNYKRQRLHIPPQENYTYGEIREQKIFLNVHLFCFRTHVLVDSD